MIRTFAALALTAALFAPAALAQDAAPQRYAVELQLMEAGKDVVVAHTFVAEGSPASLTRRGAGAASISRATHRRSCPVCT